MTTRTWNRRAKVKSLQMLKDAIPDRLPSSRELNRLIKAYKLSKSIRSHRPKATAPTR